MKRELSYREEMVQHLHIVRGETHKAEETCDFKQVFAKLTLLCYFETRIIMFLKSSSNLVKLF